ncbi:hypothetical protein GL279_18185 [Paracoccus limosus]|uniref:Flavodoxin-like fold domain-containing protein n=1 Tax=Paracoccus limosus TaxID=913252 RepID=A0A844H687_9RHOB|nr:NAD(P)H-dependent oxidoreductase [Paracoccus limosus]MTH36519.1 hypothetical protein [Paracoccus limosus]
MRWPWRKPRCADPTFSAAIRQGYPPHAEARHPWRAGDARIQWYSTPALMKSWQDGVLTRMFYIAYEQEGRALKGTPLMIAATAGNVPDAYRPGGRNMFPIIDLLAPLRATAHRCGLAWAKPFILYEADKLAPEALEAAGADYATVLEGWIQETVAAGQAA